MTDDAKPGRGVAYQVGWVAYWICVTLAILWVAASVLWVLGYMAVAEMGLADLSPLDVMFVLIPTLLIYGLGRLLRYVLSGK